VPVSATTCGLVLALSVIATEPLIAPAAVGSNSTTMLHCAPAFKDEPQLLLWEKLALVAMPLIVIVLEPVLENVTVCEALDVFTVWPAKVRLVGEKVSVAVGVELVLAVPVRLTLWALLVALSVTNKLPVLVPLAVGLKVMEIVHCAPAASDALQLLLWEKLPLTVILLMLMVVVPVLARVTD